MGLIQYAESELALLRNTGNRPADEMNEGASDDVMELIRVLEGQGHSGGSAKYVLKVFDRVARFFPATPLTGTPEEWASSCVVLANGTSICDNLRFPSVKRCTRDNGVKYRDYNVLVSDNVGYSWFSGWNEFYKRITFPYMPSVEPHRIYIERKGDGSYINITENPARQLALRLPREAFYGGI